MFSFRQVKLKFLASYEHCSVGVAWASLKHSIYITLGNLHTSCFFVEMFSFAALDSVFIFCGPNNVMEVD